MRGRARSCAVMYNDLAIAALTVWSELGRALLRRLAAVASERLAPVHAMVCLCSLGVQAARTCVCP